MDDSISGPCLVSQTPISQTRETRITLYNSDFAAETSLSFLRVICGADLEYHLRFSLSRLIFLKSSSESIKNLHLHTF